MPTYDRKCSGCGALRLDCWEAIAALELACASCGAPTRRVILPRRVAIKTDEQWIGGKVMYNGFPEPRTFYSQSSYERALADNGFRVRGDGEEGPGAWISKDSLEKAKELSMPASDDKIVITDAEGEPAELPNEPITDAELELLLQYKQFLSKRGYREAVYCSRCWGNNLEDGTEFRVQSHGASIEALIKCRCRVAYGRGGRVH